MFPHSAISDEINEEHSMKDPEGPGAIDPPILHCFVLLSDWLGYRPSHITLFRLIARLVGLYRPSHITLFCLIGWEHFVVV